MSIATTVRTAGPFAGTGSLVALPFAFKVFAASDLVVQRTNVAGDVATLTLTTHYSVSLNSDQDTAPGGTVTLVTALAVGETAALTSSVSATQPLQLASGGPFLPGQIEDALDRAMIVVQQQGVLGEQALRVPLGETALILPIADQRANKALLFDADGDPYLAAPASGSAADLALSIASTAPGKGAALVGYLQAGAGAVARTAQDKLREQVSAFDFMTAAEIADVQARTLTINVLPKLQAAVAASKKIFFPDGAYFLGAQTTSSKLLDFSASGDGITISAGKNVEFVASSSGSGTNPMCFYFRGNSRVYIGAMSFRDTGFLPVSPHIGMTAIHFDCATITADCGDIQIESVSTNGCTGAIVVAGSSIAQTGNNTFRLRNIQVGQVHAVNGYYAVNFQANGDDLTISNIYSENNFRSLYVYGLAGVNASVFVRNNRLSSGSINIATFGNVHKATEAIRVIARMQDNSNNFTPVLITTVNDSPNGVIRDIDISIDVVNSSLYNPVRFVNYTGSGGAETSSPSSHIVNDVRLRGVVDGNSIGVDAQARYSAKGRLKIEESSNFVVTQDIATAFYVDRQATAFVPAWTASTTNPAIGNGTNIGTYVVSGGVCLASFRVTFGSTSTAGSGTYSFAMPFIAQQDALGDVHILDAGTNNYLGAILMTAGSNIAQIVTHLNGVTVGAASPITWAPGDYIRASISYQI